MKNKDEYLNIQRAILELDEFKENTHDIFRNRFTDEGIDDSEFLNWFLIEYKNELYVMSFYYGWIETERTFYKWNGEKLIEVTEEEDDELREFDDENPFSEQDFYYFLIGVDNDGTRFGEVKEI